jgi:hypothetical protein
MYLVQPDGGRWGLPKPSVLDEIGYRAIVVGFPFLTLVIVLGAVWADVAWGRYWSWDPKETASLVTWLIYGAYLHARVVRGWRGQRAAVLLLVGFAATLFTYFGNLFFGGLHGYPGWASARPRESSKDAGHRFRHHAGPGCGRRAADGGDMVDGGDDRDRGAVINQPLTA